MDSAGDLVLLWFAMILGAGLVPAVIAILVTYVFDR